MLFHLRPIQRHSHSGVHRQALQTHRLPGFRRKQPDVYIDPLDLGWGRVVVFPDQELLVWRTWQLGGVLLP